MNASIDVLTLFLFNIVLVNIPLLYGTVGEIVTEKAGSLNLGVEGIMFMGGAIGLGGVFYYEKAVESPSAFLAVLIGLLCGFAALVVIVAIVAGIFAARQASSPSTDGGTEVDRLLESYFTYFENADADAMLDLFLPEVITYMQDDDTVTGRKEALIQLDDWYYDYGKAIDDYYVYDDDSLDASDVREIQREIHDYYAADASKYDAERKLKIRRIYDQIPSNLENKKKRVVAQRIEGKKGSTFANYEDEFESLISAGIALNVQAISTPTFPLIESSGKNLLKLYLNDVGILTSILYGSNIRAILEDERSINLGSVYESVVASELIAHGYNLFYYDNRSKGEVDYLIDDYDSLSAVPIEVKSGKDYTVHSALSTFIKNDDYHVKKAFVLSNTREITTNGKITYLPIYDVMFLQNNS